MKLLFFSFKSPYETGPHGGAETSMRLMARTLAARGHEVVFASVDAGAEDVLSAAAEGVRVLSLPGTGARRPHEPSGLHKLRAAFRFRRVLSEAEPDILYMFYELGFLEAALLACIGRRRPKIVLRMAGLRWYEKSKGNRSVEKRYRAAFSRVDLVNYISEGLLGMTQERCRELGWPDAPGPFFVGDIGSSARIGRRHPYPDTAGGPFRIAMAARFSDYQKRQDILVEALRRIPDATKVHVTFIGEGPRRAGLEKRVSDLGLGDRVRFLPFLEQPALWKELEDIHLLCHCTEYEGLGKIVVEAMALGVPCMVSDVPPLSQMIHHGRSGFLVRNTPEDWAGAIAGIAASPDLAARAGEAAVFEARRNFDPERNASLYEQQFEQLISHTSSGGDARR